MDTSMVSRPAWIPVKTWWDTSSINQLELATHANMAVTTAQVQPSASNASMECI